MAVDRKIRQSQTITPFGVGAIYDFGAESFVAMDISKWRVEREADIRLPRLEKVLRVHKFKAAPVAGRPAYPGAASAGQQVPYVRFPAWLFCPNCRVMHKWSYAKEKTGVHPVCSECRKSSKLAPMRFMAVCRNGHLMDIPWVRWAHRGARKAEQRDCRHENLIYKSDPTRGAGTQSLIVACRSCLAENDLDGLQHKDSLKGFFRCQGKHPWEKSEFSIDCDQIPQVVQRGGSNAYFADTTSAIDIRVGGKKQSNVFDQIRLHEKWQPLLDLKANLASPEDAIAKIFIDPMVNDPHLKQLGVTAEIVWNCLFESDTEKRDVIDSDDPADLLKDEWNAFISPPKATQNDNFVAEQVNLEEFEFVLPESEHKTWREFSNLVSTVTLARKLRIVTALTGFSRLEHSYEYQLSPSLGANSSWLPATEIYGEGIFLALNAKTLDNWEKKIPHTVLEAMRDARKRTTLGFLPAVTERFVLLHTFAHLLIRQLCFECGYSSSSLTERIYSDAESGMAGILIYTASADSEGALGGLVRQGQPERLLSTVKTALFRGSWCSNDPICSELPRQGVQGLNKSACHACTLIAETACNHANSMLDRSLLFGEQNDTPFGYFSNLIALTEETL
ncbi:DUF1998 domain-containing protein [Lacimicrobium alkaliphilum]|uniref:DUF1998 domain-containing protein n=1 Tax=Lacimicrobium alkaliphilum TaxID=1526571 RepID=UPI000BFEFF96|nr:DUF1998 domain-containing protein [Lacimicrobium alkaliphilum]